MKLWLFKNHLGQFRYVKSAAKPRLSFVYAPELHHIEQFEPYHGSHELIIKYYTGSDKKIYFYTTYDYVCDKKTITHDLSYFEPTEIGIEIPECLIKDEYKNLTFEDGPIEINEA